ncbi:hypothetical protein [Streptomyces decoyicus]
MVPSVSTASATQMTRNLLTHHGQLVHFDGITLRAWFTPAELAHVSAETLKEQDRLGYRATALPHFADFFRDHPAEELQAADDLVQTFQQIKGVGPYTAAITASHASRTSPPSVWTGGTARSSPVGSSTSTTPHPKRSPAD